jgi:murein tripeptide amidase MpaA
MEYAEIEIDADFPGGNIVAESAGDGVYELQPDMRDTSGDWFYWYFRARPLSAGPVEFRFPRPRYIGLRGPCCSTDGGRNWGWLGRTEEEQTSWTYEFTEADSDVRFAFSFPYTEFDLHRCLQGLPDGVPAACESLGESRGGRRVELIRAGCLDGMAAHTVVVTCRHHACESVASYVLEGLLLAAATDSPAANYLRQNVLMLAVPFVDKDGVEEGDQGKNRKPHDHNRDYVEGIYPEVRAIRKLVREHEANLRVALDLHCPNAHGHMVQFVGCAGERARQNLEDFSRGLQEVANGPLPYSASNNLPYGQGWNQGKELKRQSFAGWAQQFPHLVLANTLETPYADAEGVEVTPASARRLGHDLAAALSARLATLA